MRSIAYPGVRESPVRMIRLMGKRNEMRGGEGNEKKLLVLHFVPSVLPHSHLFCFIMSAFSVF